MNFFPETFHPPPPGAGPFRGAARQAPARAEEELYRKTSAIYALTLSCISEAETIESIASLIDNLRVDRRVLQSARGVALHELPRSGAETLELHAALVREGVRRVVVLDMHGLATLLRGLARVSGEYEVLYVTRAACECCERYCPWIRRDADLLGVPGDLVAPSLRELLREGDCLALDPDGAVTRELLSKSQILEELGASDLLDSRPLCGGETSCGAQERAFRGPVLFCGPADDWGPTDDPTGRPLAHFGTDEAAERAAHLLALGWERAAGPWARSVGGGTLGGLTLLRHAPAQEERYTVAGGGGQSKSGEWLCRLYIRDGLARVELNTSAAATLLINYESFSGVSASGASAKEELSRVAGRVQAFLMGQRVPAWPVLACEGYDEISGLKSRWYWRWFGTSALPVEQMREAVPRLVAALEDAVPRLGRGAAREAAPRATPHPR